MILEDELNMVYDLGCLTLYDSNPRDESIYRDELELKKILNYNLNKMNNLLVAHKKNLDLDQEVRPLAAKVIDFDNGTV
jgi:hypothetical protein